MKTFGELKARDKIFIVYKDGTICTFYVKHKYRESDGPRLYLKDGNWIYFVKSKLDLSIDDAGYYVICSCPEAIAKWLIENES